MIVCWADLPTEYHFSLSDAATFGPNSAFRPGNVCSPKNPFRSVAVPKGLSPQTSQLVKMIESWIRAATPRNITSASLRAGIQREFDPLANPSYARVDRSKATKVRHFWLTDANEAYSKRRINLE